MKPVHSRMPLMIHENDIQKWFDDKSYKELLLNSDNDLKIVAGNIQQSLF